uniref:Uncharacterized protein n=1 Tax=Oryza glumipatula TaxID=40148 RepID=A0A0E0B7A5_9ORYZ
MCRGESGESGVVATRGRHSVATLERARKEKRSNRRKFSLKRGEIPHLRGLLRVPLTLEGNPGLPGSPTLWLGYTHVVPRSQPSHWLWVRKGRGLDPELGFPASSSDIHRFGGSAREIWRVEEKKRDHRSYAKVVMDRRPLQPRVDQELYKRRMMDLDAEKRTIASENGPLPAARIRQPPAKIHFPWRPM